MTEPIEVLQRIYGFDAFRGQQAAVIDHVCAGHDALVLMPTGGGKSLCYQIPAIVLPGLALVISPLIALMRDQVAALNQFGVAAAYLNSSLAPAEQQQVIAAARNGDLDLLYIAPERLLRDDTLRTLAACSVCLIAIDEAHCVSSWGHDFRQDYLELHRLAEAFPGVPRMALTATADERTREDIVQRLGLNEPERFVGGFDRPNICYSVQPKTDARKQLLGFLREHPGESGIIYCLSRKSVETTAEWLHGQGFDAMPYHAGLSTEERNHHQERFLREDAVIMVATVAFGMGIDKPDVRFVAHLDLPKSMEAYYQETGRAGRDGLPADAWMVYGLQDVVRVSRMVEESPADEAHKRLERTKLDGLLGWCEVTGCRRQALLAYFGEILSEPCGNCDTCLRPPITWDATEAAQKALSCVFRTGQRFGAGHVIDVLRGQRRDKVVRFHHDELSTFGIGEDFSDVQWRSIFRQLVVRGYLTVEHGQFGALRLADDARPLLRGETTLKLREVEEKPKRRSRPAKVELELEDEELMEALREARRELASENGVPPYVIFHDATLLEMIQTRPQRLSDMLQITGVGQAKLEKYGSIFLEVIQRFHPPADSASTIHNQQG
jgi:ATP-dependent DNA helicase RecQ